MPARLARAQLPDFPAVLHDIGDDIYLGRDIVFLPRALRIVQQPAGREFQFTEISCKGQQLRVRQVLVMEDENDIVAPGAA